jgi:hypothetical protein
VASFNQETIISLLLHFLEFSGFIIVMEIIIQYIFLNIRLNEKADLNRMTMLVFEDSDKKKLN